MQVSIMMLWFEFDLIFAFFFMQLSIMIFWIELDLIFAFFYILHAGDLHGVLEGFFLQPLLHAGDPHAVLGEFDPIFTFFCMQVITMVFWTVLDFIFTFFLMLFWGELDLIFTISSLKVITMVFC